MKQMPEKAAVEALADIVEALSALINAFPEATDKGLLRDGMQCLLDVAIEADIAADFGMFNDEARSERSKPTVSPDAGPEVPTLRDFFAAHIAGGMVAGGPAAFSAWTARDAFGMADAMIDARDKK